MIERTVRVGVYAFNLYFGGRRLCGGSTAGWRWLDVRALAQDLIDARHNWVGATLERVIYCTAMIDRATNAVGHAEQDTYIRALRAANIVDWVEFGHYVARVKRAPLATEDGQGKPIIATADWPVKVQDSSANNVPHARFIVSYAFREEKGSDVNLASHLLLDTLEQRVDAAVVISNDSDLALPLREARKRIPVGTVNRRRTFLAAVWRARLTRVWGVTGGASYARTTSETSSCPIRARASQSPLHGKEKAQFRRIGPIISDYTTRPLVGPGFLFPPSVRC
jgi:hypothetical protein